MPFDLYQQLQACREDMARNGVAGWKHDRIANLAAVFVPVRPRPDAVHGALRRASDEWLLPRQRAGVAHLRGNRGAERPGRVGVPEPRHHILALDAGHVDAGVAAAGHASTLDDLLDCLAWSIFAKIGDTKGNPPVWSMVGQAALAARSLRHEIRTMRPTLVLMCAGKFAVGPGRPVFEAVFGPTSWDGDSIELGRCEGVPVLFTPHPKNLQLQNRWEASI